MTGIRSSVNSSTDELSARFDFYTVDHQTQQLAANSSEFLKSTKQVATSNDRLESAIAQIATAVATQPWHIEPIQEALKNAQQSASGNISNILSKVESAETALFDPDTGNLTTGAAALVPQAAEQLYVTSAVNNATVDSAAAVQQFRNDTGVLFQDLESVIEQFYSNTTLDIALGWLSVNKTETENIVSYEQILHDISDFTQYLLKIRDSGVGDIADAYAKWQSFLATNLETVDDALLAATHDANESIEDSFGIEVGNLKRNGSSKLLLAQSYPSNLLLSTRAAHTMENHELEQVFIDLVNSIQTANATVKGGLNGFSYRGDLLSLQGSQGVKHFLQNIQLLQSQNNQMQTESKSQLNATRDGAYQGIERFHNESVLAVDSKNKQWLTSLAATNNSIASKVKDVSLFVKQSQTGLTGAISQLNNILSSQSIYLDKKLNASADRLQSVLSGALQTAHNKANKIEKDSVEISRYLEQESDILRSFANDTLAPINLQLMIIGGYIDRQLGNISAENLANLDSGSLLDRIELLVDNATKFTESLLSDLDVVGQEMSSKMERANSASAIFKALQKAADSSGLVGKSALTAAGDYSSASTDVLALVRGVLQNQVRSGSAEFKTIASENGFAGQLAKDLTVTAQKFNDLVSEEKFELDELTKQIGNQTEDMSNDLGKLLNLAKERLENIKQMFNNLTESAESISSEIIAQYQANMTRDQQHELAIYQSRMIDLVNSTDLFWEQEKKDFSNVIRNFSSGIQNLPFVEMLDWKGFDAAVGNASRTVRIANDGLINGQSLVSNNISELTGLLDSYSENLPAVIANKQSQISEFLSDLRASLNTSISSAVSTYKASEQSQLKLTISDLQGTIGISTPSALVEEGPIEQKAVILARRLIDLLTVARSRLDEHVSMYVADMSLKERKAAEDDYYGENGSISHKQWLQISDRFERDLLYPVMNILRSSLGGSDMLQSNRQVLSKPFELLKGAVEKEKGDREKRKRKIRLLKAEIDHLENVIP